jgi:ATP-dependent helicase HrpB
MNLLPIDAVMPDLLEALRLRQGALLHAPPGAGKTTRVPLALLDSPWLMGTIIMLEPRRLAAVNAARWMASLLGEEVGKQVGYAIRYERKLSAATRIQVVTEGILTRRLQSDPLLSGVSLVIFDEFHERNLNSDLALALCRDVQQGLRDDLKILVMSATLECEPVARLLGDVPLISSTGRSFPVELRYLEQEPQGRLPELTAGAVQKALGECDGDILVFLPGYGEIIRTRSLLQERLGGEGPLICPLYADLPFREQELAIMPGERRKVVLATTIAETSLTIQGVSVVIDAGWSRQPRFDPAKGLPRLETVRVSGAAADQRAGRAGRLGPGICYRLWSAHTQRHLLPFSPPEITVTDLSGLALELSLWGVNDPYSLPWLDPPPVPALAEARRLLRQLGALDEQYGLTPVGRAMGNLGLHPRLARLLLAGEELGYGGGAALCCALLTERDLFRRVAGPKRRLRSDNDLFDRYEAYLRWRQGSLEADVDPVAASAVERLLRQLSRGIAGDHDRAGFDSRSVGRLLLKAYPDRLARQRELGSDRYLLANGRGSRLTERSSLHDEPYLVAVLVEGGDAGEGQIHLAAAVDERMIREELKDVIFRERRVSWDERGGRVVVQEEERLDALVLSSRQVPPVGDETATALLDGIIKRGIERLPWSAAALQFRYRVDFCARLFPEERLPDFTDTGLAATVRDWLFPWLSAARSLADVARVDLMGALRGVLQRDQIRFIDEMAPTHLTVPSGSRIALQYGGAEPVLAVKLQELFGLGETPAVARGRVPLLLHLLSPAGRPIQVTRDLKGFWNGAYGEVKKELKGRYPRHPWPDDPWSATPTKRTKRRE